MNLAAINLNLLVAFDALMAERSVSQAADRIGVSQPAMSKRLSSLRLLLKDELFLRTRDGIRPTEKALDLAETVRAALAQLETALGGHRAFKPEASTRTFRISATDHVAATLLPRLMTVLRDTAPKLTIVVRFVDRRHLAQALEDGDVDIGLTILPDAPSSIQRQDLFHEDYVSLVSANHPEIRDELTLELYLKYRHVLITMVGDTKGYIDRKLAERGLKRRVALSLPYHLVVPNLIAQTDMITTMSSRVANLVDWPALKSFPIPLEDSGYRETMLWHSRNDSDPAHAWVRREIKSISDAVDRSAGMRCSNQISER